MPPPPAGIGLSIAWEKVQEFKAVYMRIQAAWCVKVLDKNSKFLQIKWVRGAVDAPPVEKS